MLGRPVTFLEPEAPTAGWKQFHAWPPEILEAIALCVASAPAEAPWVASRALLPPEVVRGEMGCMLQGCGVSSPMVNREPTNGGWCKHVQGDVTRWFCSPGHLTQYARERKLGRSETASIQLSGEARGRRATAPLEVLRERETPKTRADHYYLEHGVDPYNEPWYDGLTIHVGVTPRPPRGHNREEYLAKRRADRDRINEARGKPTNRRKTWVPREPVEETKDAT
jgi:hypothetical protein